MPAAVPAYTINKACASGMQAVVNAAAQVRLGEAEVVLAGGTEHMSSIPYLATNMRWGQKLGDQPLLDAMYRDGYLCPLCDQVMGETSETLVDDYRISRNEQDEYALRSHQRAARAQAEGRFAAELVSVTVGEGKRATTLERDEHVRADASLEGMAKLRPVFRKDGTITPGNASAITDGAAAVMVLSEAAVKAHGVKPLGSIVGAVSVGVEPARMGLGPVPAVRKLLARHDLTLDAIDLIELNEAFASQVIACDRELGMSPDRLNVNGGGIALGHPTGCSGTRILVHLLHELTRTGGRYGIATLCVSGGQGMAVLVERG
ncbi:MAG: thiolase family protein [bacterium]